MAKVQEIGPYSAYAIAVKYGYKGTEEEWVQEQEANRKAAEAAAAAAEQSAKNAAAAAASVTQSGQQAVRNIQNAQTTALQAIDTAKQQAVQAAQAEAEKAANSAGQAASSAAEAAQSATSAAAEVGKVQSAGTSAVQAVQQAQSTATEAVSAAQQTATQAVSQAQTAAVSAVQEAGTTQTSAVASAASSALSGIAGAKDAALSDVAQAGAEQVSAVGTAGTSAVQDVNDAKTAALKEIDDANAALPSPTQSDAGKVPTVKTDGSAYELAGPYAPLSAAIRPTASGNPISITDSVEWPLQGLKVYGKSTQDGTPSPESPVPIVSAGDGGEIGLQIAGKNLLDYTALMENKGYNGNGELIPNSGYVSTPKIPVASGTPYRVNTNRPDKSIATIWIQWDEEGNMLSREASIPDNSVKTLLDKTAYLAITFYANIEVQWLERSIISEGSDEIDFESYVAPQSLTISTPNGLPGIPVDSGGNYTDTSGQQWASNSRDFDTNQYIEMVGIKQTADAVYSSDESANELLKFYINVHDSSLNDTGVSAYRFVLCDIVEVVSQHTENDHDVPVVAPYGHTDYLELRFWFPKSQYTPETAKEVLSRGHVYYPLATPIKTPLPEEEIAAYRALHSYPGTTVVSTAEDVAGLEVKYLADGEKYVERIVSQKASQAAAAHTMALLADGIREGVNGV